jgi:hypothetical protein
MRVAATVFPWARREREEDQRCGWIRDNARGNNNDGKAEQLTPQVDMIFSFLL